MITFVWRRLINTLPYYSACRSRIATPPPDEISGNKTEKSARAKNKPNQRATKSAEFNNYIKSLTVLKQTARTPNSTWATNFIRVKRGSQASLYLAHEEVGDEIRRMIEAENLDRNATVIEFNPGFGILTQNLKNSLGFHHINCFEDDTYLGSLLTERFGVNVIPCNFFSLPRLHHADNLDGDARVSNIFSKLDRGNRKLHIFGATGSGSIINFGIRTIVTNRVLYEEDFLWDKISYYILLGSKPTAVITSSPSSLYTLYRPPTILFQLLYKYKVLGTVERKAFLPWEYRNPAHDLKDPTKKYKKLRISYDPEKMFFLHFSPNMEVIKKVGQEKLIHLWYFIRHNLHSRKSSVIAQMEQWVPGCGPRLILKGFTIFTQFGSLSPPEILDLYLSFSSWPEYSSCSFLTAAEKYQARVESSEDVRDFLPKPI